MTLPGGRTDDVGAPSADEIRSALDRVLASEPFRGSPQLAAFLRYVVETTLRGEADRLKGYTIAIEALGRSESFDPQTDPIVRVEAVRLRRAMSRYYGDEGSREPVIIELPLGSYVPIFRRAVTVPPARAPMRGLRVDWKRLVVALLLVLAGAAIYAALEFWFDLNKSSRRAPQQTGTPACRAPDCPTGTAK